MASNDLVAKWLMRLGRAVSAAIGDEQAQRWFETIAPMLAGRFPDGAFTLASLEHVAAACPYLPAYAKLVEHLGEWWRDNQPPAPAAIAGPPGTPRLSAEDRVHATVWLKRRDSGQITDIVTDLSAIRSYRPAAFDHLVATDSQCRAIAKRRGWLPTDSHQSDWQDLTELSLTRKLIDIETIPSDSLRAAALALLRKAVATHAGHLAHLVPSHIASPDPPPRTLDEQLAEVGISRPQPMTPAEQFFATYGRMQGELSTEQLAKLRASSKSPQNAA